MGFTEDLIESYIEKIDVVLNLDEASHSLCSKITLTKFFCHVRKWVMASVAF